MESIAVKQNYILVEPISMKNKQVGSLIILEDIEDKKTKRGRVVAVGDGVMPDGTVFPIEVKTGETVLYGYSDGHTTKMDHKDYVVIKEDDIIAVLED
jgi:chaperonin GroES